MPDAIDALQELLVLSGTPVDTGSPEQWERARWRLRRRFPSDFMRLVTVFGDCVIEQTLRLLTPFSEDAYFWQRFEDERITDQDDHEALLPQSSRPAPRPKGMVTWGAGDDGGLYHWVTGDSDPDRWTVYVEWDLAAAEYPMSMSEFLLAGIRRQLDAHALGDGFPGVETVYADPVVPMLDGHVRFDRSLSWGPVEEAILSTVFGMPRVRGNRDIVRPQRWTLHWWADRLVVSTLPGDIDEPKPQVAALAEALGVRIVDASPSSWAGLVT